MKKKLKNSALYLKNQVMEHKAYYTFIACAIVHSVIMTKTIRTTNSFLKEKGLDPLELWNNEAFLEK